MTLDELFGHALLSQEGLEVSKEKVLRIAKDLQRGLDRDETAMKELLDLVVYLEQNNPTKEPLTSTSISGR